MLLIIFIVILAIIYCALVIYYWQSWKSIPFYKSADELKPISVSVIIPARNEEQNIGDLLRLLEQQEYPASFIEIIVIDDQSTDRTADIVGEFTNVILISQNDDEINSYKKKAIATGIAAASSQLIITTDADCKPGPQWIRIIVDFHLRTGSVFIAAPVDFESNSSILENFQALDFMVLQGITGAAVSRRHLNMCNGANIAYTRSAFNEVNGFAGIDDIASGDDMLLMSKIANKFPDKVGYLKSEKAIVRTSPMKTWSTFFNQRIRWASKATRYQDKRIFWVLLLVYLFNLSFLVLFFCGFFNSSYWILMLGLLMVKMTAELPLFSSLSSFFTKQRLLPFALFFQPLHILYTILSGILGQFGKYEWKGRKVR